MCKARVVQGKESDEEKVHKDVMDWFTARRTNSLGRRNQGRKRSSRTTDRWFRSSSRVDGSKTFPLMVSPSDKVDHVMRRILNSVKS